MDGVLRSLQAILHAKFYPQNLKKRWIKVLKQYKDKIGQDQKTEH